MRTRSQAGFTMLEMIVVVAVIAILASIALPLTTVFEDRARRQATQEELRALDDALIAWYEDWGSLPADLDSLRVNGYLEADSDPTGHRTDAWYNAYTYTVTGMTAALVSMGADRALATSDDISLTVTASASARADSRDEIATIHVSLRNYETERVPSSLPNLPNHWDVQGITPGAFQDLVAQGLIPNEPRFLSDSWGSTYAYGGTPEDYVTSPNVGGGGP